ncbi:MAG TPA: NADH-quinone oxidoreductase subunit M, partial [Gammaproteobacteria bacterium]|nr:NADH-quinone oxidoreductase subunit M [Gammaproteobacteria bacterium]
MSFLDSHLLSILIWLPILGGVLVLATGDDRNAALARKISFGFSVATLLASLSLYRNFDLTTADMQFVEQMPWINIFDIQYFLGVDGISVPLILLTTFLTVIVVVAGWEVIQERTAQYFAAFLFMEGFMVGVFSALDGVLFYLFWEAMLIPMFLIIGVWGGQNRVYAAIKFFLYTLLGSLLMLVAIIYLYSQSGSFSVLEFHKTPLGMTPQILIFLAFLAAFSVKVPMVPVHTWLPDAHVEAPTGG